MISDGLQLTLDSDHWNSIHPEEELIQIPMDFTELFGRGNRGVAFAICKNWGLATAERDFRDSH